MLYPITYVLRRIPSYDRGNPETVWEPGRKTQMRIQARISQPGPIYIWGRLPSTPKKSGIPRVIGRLSNQSSALCHGTTRLDRDWTSCDLVKTEESFFLLFDSSRYVLYLESIHTLT
jgi:hypothetical protein